MLNTISDEAAQSALTQTADFATPISETVIRPRPRLGLGTLHTYGGLPASASGTALAAPRPVASTRPCPTAATAAVTTVALASLAASGQDAALLVSGKQFAYMTRIGATGAGAPGSHPAREPV
jgi:hypothetical protein